MVCELYSNKAVTKKVMLHFRFLPARYMRLPLPILMLINTKTKKFASLINYNIGSPERDFVPQETLSNVYRHF